MTRAALETAGVPHKLHVVEVCVDAFIYLCRTIQYDHVPKPDVVLLDLNIQSLKGHELLGEMKRKESFRDIPVVVLTSSKIERDMLKSFGMQADRYVTKPAGLQACACEMKTIKELAHP
ncbi:MAG: response regulator [Burkholderiales bacterium]